MDYNIFNTELTIEDMLFASEIFQAQYMNRSPVPELFGEAPLNDGKDYLTLTNIPMNRASIAVLEAFKDEKNKGAALIFRLLMLPRFLEDARTHKWVRKGDDGADMLHHNIYAALAKCKIAGDDKRDLDSFLDALIKSGEPE